VTATVAAIVLAAGGASRFGSTKTLAVFRGRTLVRRAVDCATSGGCAPVYVVVGAGGEAIEREIRTTAAVVVANPAWRSGPGSSVRAGVTAAMRDPSVSAFLFLACDQPLLTAEVVRSLLDRFDGAAGRVVAASYAGTVGVPALFEASLGPLLLALPDDRGAKEILLRDPALLVRVPWDDGAKDVDRPGDLTRLV
jgi:CTP:molybdopterin cytidylyltransferase MocA